MMDYFQLDHDFSRPGRWYLNGVHDSAGNKLDSRVFGYGLPIDVTPPFRLPLAVDGRLVEVTLPLRIGRRREGFPLDFTLADFDVPVASPRVAQLLAAVAGEDIQRFPILVDSCEEEYEIINVISREACIDAQRSKIEWWTEADGRPDKIGKPRMVMKLVIDSRLARGHHLLRPDGWEVVAIVSDLVKRALETAQVTGVTFRKD